MLNIKRFECNMFRELSYVISDETNDCVLIDCGALYPEEHMAIDQYIADNKLNPVHLLATHGHIDHHFGDEHLWKRYGLKTRVHKDETELMDRMKEQAEVLAGMQLTGERPPVGDYFTDEDVFSFGNHTFTVIHTPGHSPGSVCFYCEAEKLLVSGDTLFKQSIGRTDFWGGSMFMMIQSLRLLSQLPDDTVVLPGHGPQTTIGNELATNPYMDR